VAAGITIMASEIVHGSSASPPTRRHAITIPPAPSSRISP
jgi:hypothetical protein